MPINNSSISSLYFSKDLSLLLLSLFSSLMPLIFPYYYIFINIYFFYFHHNQFFIPSVLLFIFANSMLFSLFSLSEYANKFSFISTFSFTGEISILLIESINLLISFSSKSDSYPVIINFCFALNSSKLIHRKFSLSFSSIIILIIGRLT